MDIGNHRQMIRAGLDRAHTGCVQFAMAQYMSLTSMNQLKFHICYKSVALFPSGNKIYRNHAEQFCYGRRQTTAIEIKSHACAKVKSIDVGQIINVPVTVCAKTGIR